MIPGVPSFVTDVFSKIFDGASSHGKSPLGLKKINAYGSSAKWVRVQRSREWGAGRGSSAFRPQRDARGLILITLRPPLLLCRESTSRSTQTEARLLGWHQSLQRSIWRASTSPSPLTAHSQSGKGVLRAPCRVCAACGAGLPPAHPTDRGDRCAPAAGAAAETGCPWACRSEDRRCTFAAGAAATAQAATPASPSCECVAACAQHLGGGMQWVHLCERPCAHG